MRKFSPLLVACLFFSAYHPAVAQDAKLVEAAKNEGGKVVFYTTMEVFTLDAVKAAFEKKTGIQVDYWRAGLTDVLARALSEYRAGKPVMDVIGIPGDYMQIMANDGALAKYDSPSFKGFAKDAVDPRLGARYRNILFGVIYNKNEVKGSALRTLEDIVKPEFRDKLTMPHPVNHLTTTQWLGSLDKIMPKARAEKFIHDLAAAKPVFVDNTVPAAERVSSAESAVAISFPRYVLTYNRQGANLDYVRDYNMLGDGHYINLGAKAPRPNAAKAFIDFFLDDESMKIQAEIGEFVNRRGIYPPLQDADKIKFVQMNRFTKEELEMKKKEFQKIFLQ